MFTLRILYLFVHILVGLGPYEPWWVIIILGNSSLTVIMYFNNVFLLS